MCTNQFMHASAQVSILYSVFKFRIKFNFLKRKIDELHLKKMCSGASTHFTCCTV